MIECRGHTVYVTPELRAKRGPVTIRLADGRTVEAVGYVVERYPLVVHRTWNPYKQACVADKHVGGWRLAGTNGLAVFPFSFSTKALALAAAEVIVNEPGWPALRDAILGHAETVGAAFDPAAAAAKVRNIVLVG